MPRFDVTIAGELNLDLILYGLPDELPPERELITDRMRLTLGSSSAIVAHNLAALGSQVGFQSRIGDDSLGQIALERLSESGVDVSRVVKASGPIKTALSVILQRRDWRNILTYAGTIVDLTLDDLDFEFLADSRHFHLSSFYLQRGLSPQVPELFRKLKQAGLTISLDTNDDPDDRWEGQLLEALRYVDVFLPNAREAKKIVGTDDLEVAATKLAEIVPTVVIKLGAEGAMAQQGKEKIQSPALKVDCVDPIGAGDSFDAGFLHQFVRGADLRTCLASGNRAGAFSTTRAGGTEAFRDREYREKFFEPMLSIELATSRSDGRIQPGH
jgi:sugar/nucleoside kinase (ribokinase family)